tara:strand:- start:10581 stop:12125 length:1545 start_codon:yes stop_codon:yes gene_type:complete
MKKQYIYVFLAALVMTMASCSKGDGETIQEPAKSNAKQITSFVFKAIDNDAITLDVTAIINEANKTISATVANGTDIKALMPTLVVSDKAITGPSGAKNFSSPVDYVVSAEDGTSATYSVTVGIALNSTKEIISFAFRKEDNQLYGDDTVTATIDEENKTITATVSYSANAALLIPSIVVSSNASVSPDVSQDFSNPVVYTVTAEDGTTTTYQVLLEITFTDRDVLIAIYNANPDNTLPWNLDDPDVTSWQGVSVDENNNIIGLYLLAYRDGGEGAYGYSLITLPEEISQLSYLKILDLGGNDFTNIPSPVLNLNNLIDLYLDYNNIVSITNGIGKLENLERLFLDVNKLKSLPPEIGKLKRLKLLSLYKNNLTELPKEIGELVNLEVIYIADNELTNLPAEFAQLTKITNLNLAFNKFIELPKDLGAFNSIRLLDLRYNILSFIPPEIGQLPNLRYLHLSNNQLTSIPKEIGSLTNLIGLYLAGNNIKTLPADVCNLRNTGTNISTDPGVECK